MSNRSHNNGSISKYYFDLEKCIEFVAKTGKTPKSTNSSVSQIWSNNHDKIQGGNSIDDDLKLVTKEITENKSEANEAIAGIRYDLLKTMLTTIAYSEEPTIQQMSQGKKMVFETLRKEGIICEINKETVEENGTR